MYSSLSPLLYLQLRQEKKSAKFFFYIPAAEGKKVLHGKKEQVNSWRCLRFASPTTTGI